MAKSKNDEEILQDENTESAEQAQAPKRIKLKKETEVLSQEELEAKFGGVDGDEKPTVKKQVKVKGKTTFSLEDYKKDKGVADGAKMKPESWLRMSPAFQQVTGLKGAIVGGINIVHGKSDTSKSTFALELAKFAQEDGTLVCWLITEKKWSRQRCVDMGVDLDKCIVNSDINFIEEGCDFIEELLKDQEEGRLPHDILFIWDSIGATPSKREWESAEEGESGKGMMVTAKVLRERISRRIFHKINNTKKETYPYNATLFVVNQSYIVPPAFAGGQPKLVPTGGDALTYSASLVFRFGGVTSASSKVKCVKNSVQLAFASKIAVVVEKNHVSEICSEGKLCSGKDGFFLDTKEAIEAYKKEHRDGWALEFDKDWDKVSKD
jgi:hypothetical protein